MTLFKNRKNLVFYFIALCLFLIPFFWFNKDLYSLGEDDTGLAYMNTSGTLNEALSSWYSSDHIPRFEQFAGHALIFNSVLMTIKTITFNTINLQQFTYGFLLSCAFYFIVKTLELFSQKKSVAFYLAGLFYALAPYFFIIEYYYLMPSTFAIVLAPAVAYFFFKAIDTDSYKPLLKGAIWTLFLSRALTTPAFINFLIFFVIFISLYYRITIKTHSLKQIFKYLFFYGLFAFFINAVIIIPTIYSLTFEGRSALQQTFGARNEPDYMINMLSYTFSEIKQNRLFYYLTNFFPESIAKLQGFRNYGFYSAYLDKVLFLGLSFSVVILAGLTGLIKTSKKLIKPFLIMFLLSFVFLSVNITELTKSFYAYLMLYTPVFNMNRIPSMKFHLSYLYYYSLLVGFSLNYLLNIRFKRFRVFIVSYCLLVIFFSSYIFISGRVFREEIPKNWVKAMQFDKEYVKLTRELPQYIKDDTRMLLFPLGYGFGAFIPGQTRTQTYRAMTTGFKTFTGINLFSNLKILNLSIDNSINLYARDFFYQQNLESLYLLARKLNLKYIIYIKNTKHLDSFGEIIPTFTHANSAYYAPVDRSKPVYENKNYVIYKINNYNKLSSLNFEKKQSQLEFIKIADFMYVLKAKTKQNDVLYFQELYSKEWKLYEIPPDEFTCQHKSNFAKSYPNLLECQHSNNNWLGNQYLLKWWSLPLVKLPHGIYENYANIWKLNTGGQTRYYVLLFNGQRIFIISAVISLVMLTGFSFIIFKRSND